MKPIKYITPVVIIILVMGFSACTKWLDVSPKTQVKEDVQFTNKQGFIDALFGIYQSAAKTTGYGKSMSFGLVDLLAQQYSGNSQGSPYGSVVRYNYTDTAAQKMIDQVFSNGYGAIAQANYLLKNLENTSILDETSAKIIKGEALGMRGYLHFDLARLFADRYADGANAEVSSLAYLKAFVVTPQSRIKLKDFLDLCEADLKQAEELLSVNQNIDQIALNQGNTSADLFLMFRQNHLNYWAVKATLARLYQYKGDKINALKYALEVINSGKFSFVNPTTLNVDPLLDASDLTFSSEHVFSFYVSNLKKLADEFFKSSTSSDFYGDIRDFYTAKATLDATYQSGVGYGTDIRRPGVSKSLWNEVNGSTVYTKKYYSDKSTNVKQRLIPAIRLSEMYYIAAESAPTIEAGIAYLNVVRKNRIIPELETPASRESFNNELMLEYRKEFYAEGQLWYYYKRMNTLNIPNGVGNPMTPAKYKLPLPNGEIEFGTSGI